MPRNNTWIHKAKKFLLVLLAALFIPFAICVGIVAYDQIQSRPSLNKVEKLWGHEQFNSAAFIRAENFNRGSYIVDLAQNHLSKKSRPQIEHLLGEQSGYYQSESFMTYLIADPAKSGRNWLLVIGFDSNGLSDTVFVRRNCCPSKPVQACYKFIFSTFNFFLRLTHSLSFNPQALAESKNKVPTECVDWFTDSSIIQGEGCYLNCMSLPLSLGTLSCNDHCHNLCDFKKPPPSDYTKRKAYALSSISQMYPGLTESEKELINKLPNEMMIAYGLSWIATTTCDSEFPNEDKNGPQDACRHFFWAAQLSKSLGKRLADTILTAHEANPGQPKEEQQMDTQNNALGVHFGSINTDVSGVHVINEVKKLLKQKKLVILHNKKE